MCGHKLSGGGRGKGGDVGRALFRSVGLQFCPGRGTFYVSVPKGVLRNDSYQVISTLACRAVVRGRHIFTLLYFESRVLGIRDPPEVLTNDQRPAASTTTTDRGNVVQVARFVNVCAYGT